MAHRTDRLKKLIALCMLMMIPSLALAQVPEVTWVLPSAGGVTTGITSCPSGDGPAEVVRMIHPWGDVGEVTLQVAFHCDAYAPCDGYWGSCSFDVVGVHEGGGSYRFDIQPWMVLEYESQATLTAAIPSMADVICPEPLRFRSFDLDGSGSVNLTDVSIFSAIFFGAYDSAADFDYDGAVNLSDLQLLAAHINHWCLSGEESVARAEADAAIQRMLAPEGEDQSISTLKARF